MAQQAEGALRTRIHGDLHLGQLLVTGNDIMFIDFEGEPTRPLAQRRAKDSPLRDVAGLLRSFDYAAAQAAREAESGEMILGRSKDMFDRFREAAGAAFLQGYGVEPESKAGRLLDLFLIEKAAYEVRYEAANRPQWLGIAIEGLARAATRFDQGGTA